LGALVRTYLKISLLGFGGPNAHLALMLDEVVERRRWITRERFVELIAVTNLLPGPNSSEVAIHVGYIKRGWVGALATGLSFLLPTFVMVTAASVLYFRFGSLPQVETAFWGLQPVIVAIVLAAGWKIGRAGVKTPLQGVLAGLGAVVSIVSGQAVIAAMVLGGALTWRLRRGDRMRPRSAGDAPAQAVGESGDEPPDGPSGGDQGETLDEAPGEAPDDPSGGSVRGGWLALPLAVGGGALGTLATVFGTHLWIGSVLFGGGYVLVALLEPYAVGQYGWLTADQFLDGVALTQAIPGPISTLSAFVGYAAAGVPGAVLGTAGIYLPAFVGVLWLAPRLERLREVEAVRHTLEGVVAAAAGAVAGVGASLAVAGVQDAAAGVIAGTALVLAVRFKVPSLWLVGGGLGAGVLRILLT
jgi:chromate transporter